MSSARIATALAAAGIATPAAFQARFGVRLKNLTPAEAQAMLERVPLDTLPLPPGVDADDWEQVCAIVDLVHERPASRSMASSIGPYTRGAAERIDFPAMTDEDLHEFATRFDNWAREGAAKETIYA